MTEVFLVDIEGHGPDPIYAGQVGQVSGVNIGVCDYLLISHVTTVAISIEGGTSHPVYTDQRTVPLTRVDQAHATYVMPDLGVTAATTVTVQGHYTLNGVGRVTATYNVNVIPDPGIAPPGTTDGPTYGYGIPDAPYAGPLIVQKWTFYDPHDPNPATNLYRFPHNPNKMTTPFPEKNITTKATTALDGQVLIYQGMNNPAQWQFSGDLWTANEYDMLRSWVYERPRRVVVTDHFGRPITCILQKFDAVPAQKLRTYWRHTYTISAYVFSVGEPTVVPS